jgi:hypothetical protein
MFKTSDIPSDQACKQVNPSLFLHFQKCYIRQQRAMPGNDWTEANVIQWLDTEYDDKYFYDKMVENTR